MKERIQSFEVFYAFYLKQHRNKTCRLLHIIGTTIVLALALTSIIHLNPYWLIFIPLSGYGFAWVGHFFFERNKPATFKYPLWSLKSDFKMYFQILSGKITLDSSKD
ncbi:Mpo1-like protein [Lutibacter sp.]|uniref:Mpo1-like protein n=1 Tax=Lutibacter sp. TaxID=1925666 RepID=UPI0035693316